MIIIMKIYKLDSVITDKLAIKKQPIPNTIDGPTIEKIKWQHLV